MSPRPDPVREAAEATAWIDAYLDGLSADQRDALAAVRATVHATVPEALEGISYGLPAFRYRGRPLVAYRAAKTHCSLYPMGPEVIDAHRAELAGFDLDKGTIRFTPRAPLPASLVAAITRERREAIDRAAAGRR